MQTLILDEKNVIVPKPSLWRSKFRNEETDSNEGFDWLFGVFLPVICFTFDPLVFQSSMGDSLLGEIKPFAFILSFLSVMAMSAFLIWGEKLKWFNGFLAGFFLIGGIVSLVIGVLLLPFSLLGLLLLVGALGFVPFFCANVFLRNAARAFRMAEPHFQGTNLIKASILSSMFCLVTPFVINMEISRLIEQTKTADVKTIKRNTFYLHIVSPITNFDELLFDPEITERRQNEDAIRNAYEELSGKDYDRQLNRLLD